MNKFKKINNNNNNNNNNRHHKFEYFFVTHFLKFHKDLQFLIMFP